MFLVTTQPLWLIAFVLVGLPTCLAMAGTALIRRHIGLTRLRANNEVAGFEFATVGVLYAVLLAFAVIVVWEKFTDAENAIAREAGDVAAIYRLAAGLGDPFESALHDQLTAYVNSVIAEDWPAMANSGASTVTTHALDGLYATLLTFHPSDSRGQSVLAEILHQLNLVTEVRRARLVMAGGTVPGVIWLVLFGGAVVTISFTFFFGMENLYAQTMMTGALSLLIFSALLIIVVIDHPFAGSAKVEPGALLAVLEDFGPRR